MFAIWMLLVTKGTERQNNFVISTSQDGKTFKNVLSATSGGKSISFEKYTFSENPGTIHKNYC